MQMLDKVFQIVFARFRRRLGDSRVEFAWRRASTTVSGYLVLPIAAVAAILVAIGYAATGAGTHAEHGRTGQFLAMGTTVLVAVLLDRRFRRFLLVIPLLTPEESREDARCLFRFRVATIGIFVLACAAIFALHRLGVGFFHGL